MPNPIKTDFLQPLIVPHVNMNGTDPKELVKQLMAAQVACEKALELLSAATPHGRDYIDGDQLQVARRAWFERTYMLAKLSSNLMDLAVEISKQT
jgi:hypothetical protein